MKFTLEIECDNDAFRQNRDGELCRILGEIRQGITDHSLRQSRKYVLQDDNGNSVGYFGIGEVTTEQLKRQKGIIARV